MCPGFCQKDCYHREYAYVMCIYSFHYQTGVMLGFISLSHSRRAHTRPQMRHFPVPVILRRPQVHLPHPHHHRHMHQLVRVQPIIKHARVVRIRLRPPFRNAQRIDDPPKKATPSPTT